MTLPRAVQKQVDDVNRLVESMQTPPEEEPANGAAPEEGQQEEQQEEQQEGRAEEQPESRQEEPTWEQRYRVLQGKYNAEVPRLQRDLQVAQGQIQSLQQLMANLQKPSQPEPSSKQAAKTLVRPEEIEEYGDEFLDLVGRRAQEVANPLVESLQSRLQQIEQRLGGVSSKVAQTDKEKVIAQLAARVKDWAKINKDEQFFNWLDQPDPYSGIQRGQLLNTAFEGGDAPRVIAFFEGFLNEHAAVQRGPDASGSARKARVPMDQLVAPGKPKAGTAGAQQEKRTYTRAEIHAFYADVNKGKYRSQPEVKDRIEREIITASNEGRIR